MAVIFVVVAVRAADGARSAPDQVVPILGIGGIVIVIFIVLRAVFLSRLTINMAAGTLLTRFRAIPFSEVASVEFLPERRAGVWARFRRDDGRCVAQMSLRGSLFAPATAEQWAALRHVIYAATISRGANFDRVPSTSGEWLTTREAIRLLDAQAAWCAQGNRPSSKRAPAAPLEALSVRLG